MVTSGEMSGGILAYRVLDPDVHVGQLSLEQYAEIRDASAIQNMGPTERLDLAWLDLETSMAMTSVVAGTPKSAKAPFKPKELNAAKQQAQTSFRDILRDEQLSLGLRTRAGLALASVGIHHAMASSRPYNGAVDPARIPYLNGLQKAVIPLLGHEKRTPEDDELLRSMTTLAILVEYHSDSVWALPVSPRQPWHITAANRRDQKIAKIMITDEVVEGVMSIPPATLGDEAWLGDLPHATLATYVKLPPGFARARENKKSAEPLFHAFDKIARQHDAVMNRQEEVAPSPKLPSPQEAARSAEDQKERYEVSWYLTQPSGDVRNLQTTPLRLNMINLEDAGARGELNASQQNVLGWMQLEYARLLVGVAQEKRREAQNVRLQEARVSRLEAPKFAARAIEADEAADKFFADANDRFDTAAETFRSAIESNPPERAGDALEMRLNAEAVPVYKALFTDADTLTQVVDTYMKHLIGIYPSVRAAGHALGQDKDQLRQLQLNALRAALTLLIANASDESARVLPLPASPREGGKEGQMHVTVFQMDHMIGRYDIAKPVEVRLTVGDAITSARQFVSVGLGLLWETDDPISILAKLTAAANAVRRPGGKRRRHRSTAIDDLTYRVTDAIADASEA